MRMNPLYPCGKPCSRGTHNKTMKNPTLSLAFNRSNHDPTTTVGLFHGHSWEMKYYKTMLNRHLINKTLYKSE